MIRRPLAADTMEYKDCMARVWARVLMVSIVAPCESLPTSPKTRHLTRNAAVAKRPNCRFSEVISSMAGPRGLTEALDDLMHKELMDRVEEAGLRLPRAERMRA